jgi:putative cell wall-binding protein/uncharacterized protein YkwD
MAIRHVPILIRGVLVGLCLVLTLAAFPLAALAQSTAFLRDAGGATVAPGGVTAASGGAAAVEENGLFVARGPLGKRITSLVEAGLLEAKDASRDVASLAAAALAELEISCLTTDDVVVDVLAGESVDSGAAPEIIAEAAVEAAAEAIFEPIAEAAIDAAVEETSVNAVGGDISGGGGVPLAGDRAGIQTLATDVLAVDWRRLGGSQRYETMQKIVQEAHPTSPEMKYAILTTGKNFPDALAASALAGLLDAPILLTPPDSLSASAREELLRLQIEEVVILGDTPSVSTVAESQVAELVGWEHIVRIAGADRYDTAWQMYASGVFEEESVWSNVAIVAAGTKFPDALSVAPFAYATGSPVFLYDPDNGFDANTLAALTSEQFDLILLVGGDDAATLPSAAIRGQLDAMGGTSDCLRIAGSDRYLTSAAVADFIRDFWLKAGSDASSAVAIAKGTDYPDALSGAVLAGKLQAPLCLAWDTPSGRTAIYRAAAYGFYHGTLKTGYLFGSEESVSAGLETAVRNLGMPTATEQSVIDLVNAERAARGIAPLTAMPILQGVADIRADELTHRFSHTRPNARNCDTAYSNDLKGDALYTWGENIAMGQTSPELVVAAWMASDGHRANILNEDFRHIGVGHVLYERYNYWIQFFAS